MQSTSDDKRACELCIPEVANAARGHSGPSAGGWHSRQEEGGDARQRTGAARDRFADRAIPELAKMRRFAMLMSNVRTCGVKRVRLVRHPWKHTTCTHHSCQICAQCASPIQLDIALSGTR